MDCLTARESLKNLRARRPEGEGYRLLRLHLAECRDCRSVLDFDSILELLPALDEGIQPSPDLGARFHQQLVRHRGGMAGSAARSWGWLRLAQARIAPRRLTVAAFAAFLVICVVIAGFYIRREDNGEIAPADQAIAENLPLLQDIEVISNLDLLEDFDDIRDLRPDPASLH